MKKRALFILLAGLLAQPLHAVTLSKKNSLLYKVQFDDGINFDIPRIKRYINILENPEGLEIFNIEDVIVVKSDNASTIHGIIKNKNITIKLPKEYRIAINNNSLFIYPQSIISNTTNIKNKKVRLAIEWINDNDATKFQEGLNLLTEISQEDSDSWAVHTAQGALGQLLLFAEGITKNDPNRLDNAYILLTKAYEKTKNKRIQHIACACLGQLYMMNKSPLSNAPNKIEMAFNYFNEAISKEFSPWAKHFAEFSLAQMYMKNQIPTENSTEKEQIIRDLLIKASQKTDSLKAQHFAELALAKMLLENKSNTEDEESKNQMILMLLTNASQKTDCSGVTKKAKEMLNKFLLQNQQNPDENNLEEILESGNIFFNASPEINIQEVDDKMLIDEEPMDITIKDRMSINRIILIEDQLKIKNAMSIENLLN
ncbi:MAG: hypothetical protein Q8L85_00845 [Alphaproteobacteria bacterium]|nr:hypothetical protein [Alphaproteobacteria bacterium]